MTEPLPTHKTGEGLGGSSGAGDGDGDVDKAVDRHATQDDDETVPVPTKTSQLLQGPLITSQKSALSPPPVPEFAAPLPPPDQHEARMATCRGLQATIMDFFVGASEQRIQVNASVYDLIYGSGPHAIMNAARGYHLSDMEPSFRWYHLPANNLEWVEDLLGRYIVEGNHGTRLLSEEFKHKLGLSRHRHPRTKAGRLTFKRPGTTCYPAKTDADDVMDGDAADYIFSVIPFLHFDTEEAFDDMTKTLDVALEGKPAQIPAEAGIPPIPETAEHISQAPNDETEKPSRAAGSSQIQKDNGPVIDARTGHDQHATGSVEPESHLPQPEATNSHEDKPNPVLSPRHIHRRLLTEYIGSGDAGEAPRLQPRRTLDQYFYTHLGSTRQRDKDQVVLRYTYRTPDTEPKLFMVDQLWVWIISNHTVISCLPTIWPADVDATGPRKGDRGKARASAEHRGHAMTSKGRKKQKERRRRSSLVAPAHPPIPNLAPPSSGGQRRPSVLLKDDASLLDIHQRLLAHLGLSRRAPVTSVFQLAHTITTFCIDTFDPHLVPEDYQFLDFFERSIGNVRDECARQLQRFRPTRASPPGKELDELDSMFRAPEIGYMGDSTGTGDNLSIEVETKQFVEIEDIRDELSILQLVLEDQGEVLQQMDEAFAKYETRSAPLAQNRVLEGHLRRIKKMEAMAMRTSQLLYHLIDLKQKQASILEALAMRKQADILARHAEEGAVQAKEAQEQTGEAIKQGRTVLLFTVVTIVFLPLSFMAAFFAIDIDVFPVNENGKLNLDYVLTYMLSISAGLSIPFIFVIFNQDRVWDWLRRLRDFALGMPLLVWLVLLLMGILLGTIWALGLDSAVKISITIPLVLLGVVTVITFWLYKLVSVARQTYEWTDDGSPSVTISMT